MIGRTLSKRLERLETRTMPAGGPLILQIQFVSPDGSVEDGPRFSVRGAGGRRLGKRRNEPCAQIPNRSHGKDAPEIAGTRGAKPVPGALGRLPSRRLGNRTRPQRELGGDDCTGHGDRCEGLAGEVVAAGEQFVATDIRR